MKVYFYQSDVESFTAAQPRGRKREKGDISLGYVMFNTFLARLDERVKLVDELLAAKHDFTVDEEILIDRDEAQFPKTPDEAKERWRKRIKYDLLVLKADQLEKDKKGTKDKKEGVKSPVRRRARREPDARAGGEGRRRPACAALPELRQADAPDHQ